MNDGNRIRRLLESVSDGEAIDWARERSETLDPRDSARIASLESIAAIWDFSGVAGGARLAPGQWVGHLRIVEKLGSGAYGDVFRVWDSRLEREVALKIVAPEEPAIGSAPASRAAPSYLEEARRLAGVRHPNVVGVYSIEQLGSDPLGRPAIVLELIRGRTLAEIIRRDGRLGAREVAAIGIELCRALSAVHGCGMLHRDIKAQNVMREEGGRIVLMDFGPGGGTPLYMAPEVLRGEAPAISSDLYSLGVLLYYLAAADFPVRGTTIEDLRRAHEAGRAIPLRDARADLPAPLVHAIEIALARDPASRPKSAGEMERALVAAASSPDGGPLESAPAMSGAPAAHTAGRSGASRAPAPRAKIISAHPKSTALRNGVVAMSAGLVVMIAIGAYLAARGARETHRQQAPVTKALDPAGTAAGGSFTIAAAAFRGSGQRERLAYGARVAPGDSISVSISASESIYLYVINQDERGEAYLLFPAAERRPANPLPAGAAIRLPSGRDGRLAYWQITSAGGREHMLLVASRTRLGALEDAAANLAQPSAAGAPVIAALDPAALVELRGMGGYVEEDGDEASRALRSDLFEVAAPLADGREDARGVWIRKLVLENPAS